MPRAAPAIVEATLAALVPLDPAFSTILVTDLERALRSCSLTTKGGRAPGPFSSLARLVMASGALQPSTRPFATRALAARALEAAERLWNRRLARNADRRKT